MGGTIAICMRTDEKTTTVESYTNSMPWYIDNYKFYNSDEMHLSEFLASHNNDVMDMVHCGYGIVVLDHTTKTILSQQGYTLFGSISFISMAVEDPHKTKIMNFDKAFSSCKSFKHMFESGMIKSYIPGSGQPTVDIYALTLDDIADLVFKYNHSC